MRAILRNVSNRARGEEGSALTEFAIIVPMFILLIFWAQFFTDLGIMRLKGDEASRYALWEMVAQRDPATVISEVQSRFADLSSPESRPGTRPTDARSFPTVTVAMNSIIDHGASQGFTGRINNPESGGGGVLSQVLGALNNFLNNAVRTILNRYGFETDGVAQVPQFTLQAQNTLFPGANFLGYVFRQGVRPQITLTVPPSAGVLVNTWKAWPGKYAKQNTSVDAGDPYQTYGQGSLPEKEVGKRMDTVSFFGFGNALNGINRAMQYVGLPGITPHHDWSQDKAGRNGGGPIAMLPGAPSTHSWSPANGKPLQRIGDLTKNDVNLHADVPDSPAAGVDRWRMTTPGQKINTSYWARSSPNRGGMDAGFSRPLLSSSTSDTSQNPYQRAYACRDAWYMGSTRESNARWGRSFAQWASAAFPTCR